MSQVLYHCIHREHTTSSPTTHQQQGQRQPSSPESHVTCLNKISTSLSLHPQSFSGITRNTHIMNVRIADLAFAADAHVGNDDITSPLSLHSQGSYDISTHNTSTARAR